MCSIHSSSWLQCCIQEREIRVFQVNILVLYLLRKLDMTTFEDKAQDKA